MWKIHVIMTPNRPMVSRWSYPDIHTRLAIQMSCCMQSRCNGAIGLLRANDAYSGPLLPNQGAYIARLVRDFKFAYNKLDSHPESKSWNYRQKKQYE